LVGTHPIFFVFQLLHFQAHSSFYYTHMISHRSRSIIYHPFFGFNVYFLSFNLHLVMETPSELLLLIISLHVL
jgi:hypothetical protein